MPKSKYTELQILQILSEQGKGRTVNEISRQFGISQPTFFQWKRKYAGADANLIKHLKEVGKELEQCRETVAELTRENMILKDMIAKSLEP